MSPRFVDCGYASPPEASGLRRCRAPDVVGLKWLTPDLCARCELRRVKLPPAARQPAAQETGLDETYPYFSPRMPVELAKRLLVHGGEEQPDRWWTWSNIQEAARQLASDVIDNIPSFSPPEQERGIVIAGGGQYLASAYVTIRVLRHVGCRLPVELWHFPGEIDQWALRALEEWDVRCIDASSVPSLQPFRFHPSWWKGWQLKPYAIIHCGFREVLYLDADCYPTRDPEFLFEWPPYRVRGAVFWPDVDTSAGLLTAAALSVFGVSKFEDRPTESGQLLVHRQWCWRELNLTLHLNSRADYTYRHLWGDKDTYPIAWRWMGRKYERMWPTTRVTRAGLLQYDDHGQVLFQHRVNDKFRLSSQAAAFRSTPQASAGNQRQLDWAHEDFCFRALQQWRTLHAQHAVS